MIRRRTRLEEIHSAAFSARIEAVEALRAAGLGSQNDAARAYSAAAELRVTSEQYGEAPNATIYWALADLTQMLGLLLEWRATVLNAGADASRFVVAAKERAVAWSEKFKTDKSLDKLLTVAAEITKIQSVSEVAAVAAHLAGVPLPIGL